MTDTPTPSQTTLIAELNARIAALESKLSAYERATVMTASLASDFIDGDVVRERDEGRARIAALEFRVKEVELKNERLATERDDIAAELAAARLNAELADNDREEARQNLETFRGGRGLEDEDLWATLKRERDAARADLAAAREVVGKMQVERDVARDCEDELRMRVSQYQIVVDAAAAWRDAAKQKSCPKGYENFVKAVWDALDNITTAALASLDNSNTEGKKHA